MAWISKSTPKEMPKTRRNFLSRLGYVVLALGVPAGVVLHPLAIFILFPIGVALIVFAALLDPPGQFVERLSRTFSSPIVLIGLAGIAWATLSILWTPFAVPAGQHVLKILGWTLALALALNVTREHARATDLYLFPFGLVLAMIAISWPSSPRARAWRSSRSGSGMAELSSRRCCFRPWADWRRARATAGRACC